MTVPPPQPTTHAISKPRSLGQCIMKKRPLQKVEAGCGAASWTSLLVATWPARSPSRQATLYIESSDSFVASAAASIATGWSEPVPGLELHPLKSSAFHGALLRQQCF